ncbi:MAG: ATP-binding protein [Planctomycetales bacterium]|nr:ATP-binding protein [Planctomycetales bacterium]
MRRVVLTGGPCSGKTTVQRVLREAFTNRLIHVPEAATILLEGGFPAPGTTRPWTEAWQSSFQRAVLALQYSLEDIHATTDEQIDLIVCDRGVLDGAAYTPGGRIEFGKRFNVDLQDAMRRYDVVIHLESLATADPRHYGRSNNEHRFESLEQAQSLEHAIRDAWEGHPHTLFVDGNSGVDGKVATVCRFIREFLADESNDASV